MSAPLSNSFDGVVRFNIFWIAYWLAVFENLEAFVKVKQGNSRCHLKDIISFFCFFDSY